MTVSFPLGLQNVEKFRFSYTLHLEGTQSLKISINLEPLMMIVKYMTKLSKLLGSLTEWKQFSLVINNIQKLHGTLSFVCLTMSRYAIPGFTMTISAPSLTSRS